MPDKKETAAFWSNFTALVKKAAKSMMNWKSPGKTRSKDTG